MEIVHIAILVVVVVLLLLIANKHMSKLDKHPVWTGIDTSEFKSDVPVYVRQHRPDQSLAPPPFAFGI